MYVAYLENSTINKYYKHIGSFVVLSEYVYELMKV